MVGVAVVQVAVEPQTPSQPTVWGVVVQEPEQSCTQVPLPLANHSSQISQGFSIQMLLPKHTPQESISALQVVGTAKTSQQTPHLSVPG